MNGATITIPDEMRDALEDFARRQETPPDLSTVVERALREFLQRQESIADADFRPFAIDPLEEKDDAGEPDVSVNHDMYFSEITISDGVANR